MVAMMGSPKTAEGLNQLSGLVDLLAHPDKSKKAIAELEAQIKELRKLKAQVDAGRKQLEKDHAEFEKYHTEATAALEQKEHRVDGLEGGLAQREAALKRDRDNLVQERADYARKMEIINKALNDRDAALKKERQAVNEANQALEANKQAHEAHIRSDQEDLAKQRRSLQAERTKLNNLAADIAEREKDHEARVAQLKKIIG